MDITQSKGNVTELQCLSKFIELGYECSIPYGNGAKYDFIVDYQGELIKIQCKSSSYVIKKNGLVDKDAFNFHCVTQTTNTQKTTRHKYTNEMIDYFATYFNGKVYIIPIEECSTNKTLRYKAPENKGIIYNKAEDYEIEKFFKSLFVNQQQEERKEKIFYCIDCHKNKVHKEGARCVECTNIKRRTVDRPEREILKKLIREKSFLFIGEKYGVSDNAIRKWCDSYNLPRKKKDINSLSDEDWEKI